MKKGMLFTLGLALIAFSLYGLSLVIDAYHKDYDNIFIEVAPLHRLNDLDSSLQLAIKKTFLESLNLDIAIQDTTIAISQPYPLNYSNFRNNLDNLKSFVEGNFTGIKLDFNDFKSRSVLTLLPMNITYYQDFELNQSVLNGSNMNNITNYELVIQMYENITTCTASTQPGAFNLTITASGLTNATCNVAQLVDIKSNNNIVINNLQISSTPQGGLILKAGSSSSTMTLRFNIVKPQERMLKLVAPAVIEINLSEFNVYRKGNTVITSD